MARDLKSYDNAILEKLSKKLEEEKFMTMFLQRIEATAKNALEKGKELTDVLQIEKEIKLLEKQVEQHVNKVGRYVFENQLLGDDEEVESACVQISTLYISIKNKKKEIMEVKNIIYCPTCSVELPANAKFCRECGAIIEHEEVETVSRKCPECHSIIKEDDKFCSNCGKQVED